MEPILGTVMRKAALFIILYGLAIIVAKAKSIMRKAALFIILYGLAIIVAKAKSIKPA